MTTRDARDSCNARSSDEDKQLVDDDVFSPAAPAGNKTDECCWVVNKSGQSPERPVINSENNGPTTGGAAAPENAHGGVPPGVNGDDTAAFQMKEQGNTQSEPLVEGEGGKVDDEKAQPAVRRKSLWDRLCLFRYNIRPRYEMSRIYARLYESTYIGLKKGI
jgi:hypothetical protein